MFAEKSIEKAVKDKAEFAVEYGVPISSIVWIGNRNYIIAHNGQTIRI